MPANTSDILLNSISSPKVLNRQESKSESSQSFAEHWTLHSKKTRNAGREPVERREPMSEQRSSHTAKSGDRQFERHQAADRSSQAQHDNSRQREERSSDAKTTPNAVADRPVANEQKHSSHATEGRSVESRSTQSHSSQGNEEVHIPPVNAEMPGDVSPREKFLLALLGVSSPGGADNPSTDATEETEGELESDPKSFIELLLTGGSSAKSSPGDSEESEGLELVGELEEGDDTALVVDTEPTEDAGAHGELNGNVATDSVVAPVAKAAEQLSEVKANSKADAKTVNFGSESRVQLVQSAALDESAGEPEALEDSGSDEGADELVAPNAKTKQANPSMAALLKEAAGGQISKEIVASPSATGYGEAAGINHSQSQGRLSGLEHSFQLQRSADVQGRSSMQSDINQAQWKAEVAEKIAWFSARNISRAEIRLDPPELGSLQIKIQLNQEQAQVTINSPHASVREALDQTSARLREMFQEQGLDLADVNVGGEGTQQRSDDQETLAGHMEGDSDELGEAESGVQPVIQRLGLVDSYA